jgi:hypothetical protein
MQLVQTARKRIGDKEMDVLRRNIDRKSSNNIELSQTLFSILQHLAKRIPLQGEGKDEDHALAAAICVHWRYPYTMCYATTPEFVAYYEKHAPPEEEAKMLMYAALGIEEHLTQ